MENIETAAADGLELRLRDSLEGEANNADSKVKAPLVGRRGPQHRSARKLLQTACSSDHLNPNGERIFCDSKKDNQQDCENAHITQLSDGALFNCKWEDNKCKKGAACASAAPTAAAPTAAPTVSTCATGDDSKCIDFSMDATDCAFASFKQLEQLVTTGSDATSFHDFMIRSGTPYGGYSEDCIKNVRPMQQWSPAIETTLPDGRTRKLLVPGVPKTVSRIRTARVKPADAVNVAFVVLEMPGLFQGTDRNLGQRVRGAMQVKMCKDGSVKGITSTEPLTGRQEGDIPDYVARSECENDDTFIKLDNVFRKTVAFARFQLAKRYKASTSSFCKNDANWDSTKCMNSLMPESAQCHFVDLKVVPNGTAGANAFTLRQGAGAGASADNQLIASTFCTPNMIS